MEHVDGEPITRYADKHILGVRERLILFVNVCRAVQHAHQRGVIHRDLKPLNILVTDADGSPTPKIIDFGVAKAIQPIEGVSVGLTRERQIVGTPGYMSPEQASFDTTGLDTRTDIYSLGATLYELLTGSPPFDKERLGGASPAELERIIRDEEPIRPSTREIGDQAGEARGASAADLRRALRGDLDWIVLKALEKDRSRRYQSAGALADDLVSALEDREVAAAPPTLRYQTGKFIRRHRTAAFAAAALAATLLVATIVSVGFGLRAVRERAHALDAERLAAARAEEAARQAAIAEAVNAFLTRDLLQAADPSALGRDVTMREALDVAAARLEDATSEGGTLAGAPGVEAAVRHAIGATYLSLGEYDLAREHESRALALNRSAHGMESEQAIESMNGLVNVMHRRGENEGALPIAREATDLASRTRGEEDPLTLDARTRLATVLYGLGEFDESEREFRRVIAGWERAAPNDPTKPLTALNNLSTLLGDQGRYEEAIEITERLVRVRRDALGVRHPQTLASMNNLALALKRSGRLDEAEPLYREMLAGRREALGETHPETLAAMNNLAVLLLDREQADEAGSILDTLLRAQEESIGPTHWQTCATRINLARALRMLGDFAAAERLCADAIEAAPEALPAGHWMVGVFHAHRATALEGLDRRDEALEERLEAHRIMLEGLGPDHPRTGAQAGSIADLLDEMGRTEEAASWRARGDAGEQGAG
jgi:non-specific serine/threonine protein kinase/serine/threonine-protein kinase